MAQEYVVRFEGDTGGSGIAKRAGAIDGIGGPEQGRS